MGKILDAKTSKTIGILAGMGPKSTAPFIEKVVDQCQLQYGAKNDIDFPPMMIYSLPTPFYLDRPIDEKEMKKIVMEGLQKLESTGVSFIAMPCNTAHAYHNFFQTSLSVPLLNIVEETVRSIHSKSRVTLLATSTTMNCNVYQRGIAKAGSTFIFKEEWQERVNELIKDVKEGKSALRNWKALLLEFKKEKIQTVIIACTDLSVLPKSGFLFIDSSEELAKAVVERYRQ